MTKPDIPWQEQVNCYNCAYRLSLRGKLGDYERPRNGGKTSRSGRIWKEAGSTGRHPRPKPA